LECFWCQNDQENLCERIMATKVLGSYAEYLLIPAHIARLNLFPKPESLSFDRAALLEPLACVAHAIESFRPRPSDRVLVIGPGAIGLMFASVLRHLRLQSEVRTGSVTVAGRNTQRLAIAQTLGAETILLSDLAPEPRFDVVIECTGREEIWEKSVDYVRRGGKVVLFGGCPAETRVSFDTRRLHYDQIDVISPFHFGTRAVRTAREWLLDATLELDPLISGERKLADAPAVFDDLRNGRGIKYVFRP
jgi:L-iditol 2-dehydrogenase